MGRAMQEAFFGSLRSLHHQAALSSKFNASQYKGNKWSQKNVNEA
jgi:hypothetical protein